MKIAVCDDERGILEDIERRILRFDTEYEIEKYSDGEMLLSEEFDADILFLDIQMHLRFHVKKPRCFSP